ncbi:MAG: arylesterase [Gammaproteobacteria bacterium]|nr:arylesterase [Gammaproteobacteria bacterium]
MTDVRHRHSGGGQQPSVPCRGIGFVCLTLLLLAGLGACGPSAPALPPLADDAVILAFGDSLTHGTGANDGESYPAVLTRLTGREAINAGVPGELSAAGRERLPGLLARHSPDLLILCHGGNDILRARNRQDTAANLRAMIRAARDKSVPVVLIGVPERGLWLESAQLYSQLAEEFALPLEAEVLPRILGDASLKSDSIHPNAQGYRQIAEAIHRLLRDAGAL